MTTTCKRCGTRVIADNLHTCTPKTTTEVMTELEVARSMAKEMQLKNTTRWNAALEAAVTIVMTKYNSKRRSVADLILALREPAA